MNYVVDSYENYKEENRLTTNNARRIEFVTTTRVLDEIIGTKSKILDCAAGTGIYAFWFADKGHDVTATDITPRHIDIINQTLTNKNYHMNTSVLDATDMSCFADDSFDIVLNMGPFYHLITEEQREKCMKECLRVLRKGGFWLLRTFQDTMFFNILLRAMKNIWMNTWRNNLLKLVCLSMMMRNAFGQILITHQKKKWNQFTKDID